MSTERKQRPVKPIPDALDPAETLALERRWLPTAGVLGVLSGVFAVISFVLRAMASRGIDDDIAQTRSVGESLQFFATPGHDPNGLVGAQSDAIGHYGSDWILVIAGGAATGIGILLATPVLYGLIRAAWRRRPSFPRWFLWAPVVGGVLFGLGSIVAYAYQGSQYHDFSELAPAMQTNGAAHDVIKHVQDNFLGIRVATGIGSLLGAVGLGAAALSAMNVGLLTKVIGSIGVLLAVMSVIPQLLGQAGDILRAFWFIALGLTLLGRWPGGRSAAWQSGEAVPWPTRAQLMEEADRAQAGGRSRTGGSTSDPAPAPTPKKQPGGNRKKRRK
ncbi:hypothetical protein [Patulibacter minatonensis]|uniref:hypothetical protein n=1 Tax=Patulibacter minatonensis TaxID=298163 RepID=UPI00047BC00C|nr:hypothetical protein [Patulibacter minatonensis]